MMKRRASTILFLSFAITAASFAACASTPGRAISLTLFAQGEGGASFTTRTGWDVVLTEARLAIGPVYVLAPRATALLRLLSIPTAYAHGGADEYATLGIRCEWLDQVSLDLLATQPTLLGMGAGSAGPIGDAEVDIDPPGPSIAAPTHGHQAWVAGTATMGGTSIPFEGGLDIADLTIARRVQGIPASGSVDEGSTITVVVHVRSWVDEMHFDRLAVPTTGSTREIVAGTQPYDAWILGARTSTAFAVTTGATR